MSRTLIIKTSSMGDVIHNLPIVADMRRARPDMAIDWVVEEAYADLVRLHPGVDRVIPIALRRWRAEGFGKATRAERTAFRTQLREQRYDLVLDTQGLIKSALVARSARVTADGIRAGFSFGLVREGMARLFYDRGYRVDKRLHAIERLRALAAAAVGYANDSLGPPQFGLRVPPQHFDFLRSFYVAHGVDELGSVAHVRGGIAFGQLLESGAISGQRIAVWTGILSGVVAASFRAGAVGLVGESQAQPQVSFPAEGK